MTVSPENQLTEKPPEPRKYDFPWPLIRDFISVKISEMLAQQNALVGEQMLAKGAEGVQTEQVEQVKAMHRKLVATTDGLNTLIEGELSALEGKGPRIIMPR